MANKKKNKIGLVPERQEILTETSRRSYEVIRLTRLKYKENPYTFIDLRIFQRGDWDEEGKEIFFPTKKGIQIKEDLFQRLIGKWTITPQLLFHPAIVKKAYPALRREEYDTAVFNAFKLVEIRVRKLSKSPMDLVGTQLIRKAFDPEYGVLSDMSIPKAEREAIAHLFAGCIGCYKNPHSHRDVELLFTEAFEMLLVASHLLQILDRIERRIQNKDSKQIECIVSEKSHRKQ